MTDETVQGETPETPTQVVEETAEKFDEARAKELIAKLRAAEKQGKVDAKVRAELEAEKLTRQEAEKSELQKAQDRADAAERKAKAAELANMRRDAAEKTKLPAGLADRIKGETPEEMEADALAIIAQLPEKVAPALSATNPGKPQTGETDDQRRERLGLGRH